jgi:hypothetical protein
MPSAVEMGVYTAYWGTIVAYALMWLLLIVSWYFPSALP